MIYIFKTDENNKLEAMTEIEKGERSGREEGWVSEEDVRDYFDKK